MGKFDTWLEQAKKTELRDWLNIAELYQLASQGKRPKLWVVAHNPTALRTFTVKIDGISDVKTTVEGSTDIVTDFMIECSLVTEEGEDSGMKMQASMFQPPYSNPMSNLSRVFTSRSRRDNYVEDAHFFLALNEEMAIAQRLRMGNQFMRRFLGGDGPTAA